MHSSIGQTLLVESTGKFYFETLKSWACLKVPAEWHPHGREGNSSKILRGTNQRERPDLYEITLLFHGAGQLWKGEPWFMHPLSSLLLANYHWLFSFRLLELQKKQLEAVCWPCHPSFLIFLSWLCFSSACNLDLAITLRAPPNHLMKRLFTNPG